MANAINLHSKYFSSLQIKQINIANSIFLKRIAQKGDGYLVFNQGLEICASDLNIGDKDEALPKLIKDQLIFHLMKQDLAYFETINGTIKINEEWLGYSIERLNDCFVFVLDFSSRKLSLIGDNALETNVLGNFNHEIRTPLNGILGIADIIERDYNQDDFLTDYAKLIQQSGNRLLNSFNNLSDYAKLEKGDFEITPTLFDAIFTIRHVVKTYDNLIKQNGISLKLVVPGRSVYLKNDPYLLEKILHNLLDNAIKFSTSGNEVELVCKVQDEGVKISIKDGGIGMDEGFLSKRFFKPFEQESEGYGRKFEGLGLGAYITYASIVKMQGKIICHSEKGKGTIVELTIPNID